MKTFDLFQLPLKGAHLIEASAGTGKTYTLAALFLRLVVEQGIGVERILVVTYTKAATEELKTRIRQRLLTAKKGWRFDTVDDDPVLDELRRRAPSADQALGRIQEALIDFDRAAIFTIHGFCQRLLQYFAFETGHLFQSELVQDDSPFIQETAEDFWRRYIARAPRELAFEALKNLRSPQQLAKILRLCRFPHIAVWPDGKKPPLSAVIPWRQIAKGVKLQWPQVQDTVEALLHYDGLNGRTYGVCKIKEGPSAPTPRQVKVAALCAAMDQWPGDYPLFKSFEQFSSHRLKLATNKGKVTPQHPFFDLCAQALALQDQLKGQLDAYLSYLKVRLYHLARPKMAQKKARRNLLFFDDLLLHVHRAVTGPRGNLLAEAIRSQYPIALVDEFQDTDQLQSEIFFRLFANDQSLLAMIGDPKQAIYSFRGADLFSYLQAATSAQSSTTLTKNWRATPQLIQALNAIFEGHAHPFGFKQIGFDRAVAAKSDKAASSPALRLWYLPVDDAAAPQREIPAQVAVMRIAKAVAQEIVGLLGNLELPFAPEDIAILVRTHRQAHLVKQALAQKQVPAVLHSAGRIFDTDEAQDLERVLAAVASPTNPALVRAALTSPMFGWRAALFLSSLDKESRRWQTQWESFGQYHRIWVQSGFYAMFRHMMIQEGIKKRVLDYPDGERCMTNLLHLAELLHQTEMAHGLGPEGLVKWLAFQRRSDEIGNDDQQLRLESDARAVRIITMHKSKGLQFEVVFCPFTWAGINANDQALLFHHPEKRYQLTLALGPNIPGNFQAQAQKELLAENLRMLYVALTRARQRCYWVWGRIKGADSSAPAYLLYGQELDVDAQEWIAPLKETMANLDPAQWLQGLTGLAQRARGSIGVTALATHDLGEHEPSAVPLEALFRRSSTRGFERNWRIASFSAMTAGRPSPNDERADRDSNGSITDGIPASSEGEALFDFHKGARAGLFFHDLLEHWDHTTADDRQCRALVADKLRRHGYETKWVDAVGDMLTTLAQTPLIAHADRFALNQVAPDARLNEMSFYFPLKSVGPAQIQAVFEQYADQSAVGEMAQRMGRIHFAPMHGFMKGYIDMIFSHGGRYYLVDWKSNFLGPAYGDYAHASLEKAMAESYYFLQYHIYAVALDQLLRRRLVNYDYQRHFGGVFYIFLRGLAPNPDGSKGIYYDRPDPEMVTALNRLLIAN
jgi:exodeoxyribonuclease V beta subunit